MDHKINHEYPKLQKILLVITEQNTVYIPRKNIIGNLQPIDVDDFKVSNISFTTDGIANAINSPVELPCLPPELSFLPEHSHTKHSIVIQDDHIPQAAIIGYIPYLKGNRVAIFPSHLQMLEEQIHSKWISQLWDYQLQTNHT